MSGSRADIHDNHGWAAARPALSVLIPFLGDDPGPLLRRLDTEGPALAGRVELILLDDGTGDAALTARLKAALDALALPARAIPPAALCAQTTATCSARVLAERGTGSVAEAAALAAAGPGARLLGPRVFSSDRMASCALALQDHEGQDT